jgi:hypothetical protein
MRWCVITTAGVFVAGERRNVGEIVEVDRWVARRLEGYSQAWTFESRGAAEFVTTVVDALEWQTIQSLAAHIEEVTGDDKPDDSRYHLTAYIGRHHEVAEQALAGEPTDATPDDDEGGDDVDPEK